MGRSTMNNQPPIIIATHLLRFPGRSSSTSIEVDSAYGLLIDPPRR
jgi:hypothetical protein